jgi:flagellar assembly protein FliH
VLPAEDGAGLAAASFTLKLPVRVTADAGTPEAARTAAHAQGYAAGWAHGQYQARVEAERVAAGGRQEAAELTTRVDRALVGLVAAAAGLERRMAPVAADLEDRVLAVAVELAGALLGRELAVATEPGLDALRRALLLTPANRPVTVRLNPADLADLCAGGSPDRYEIAGRVVTLLPDAGLARGDAVADCDATTVDARLGAAMDRLRAAVAG